MAGIPVAGKCPRCGREDFFEVPPTIDPSTYRVLCAKCGETFGIVGVYKTAFTDDLIRQRQETHGDAWKTLGELMVLPVIGGLLEAVKRQSSYGYAWLMILAKLVRASYNPTCLEHWEDIAGYAQLCINDLKEVKSG